MAKIIIGTAGHVDHGKTALTKALTGMDTDRLAEEKSRGISIALGFALLLLDDLQIGIVDVPGHERFVKTMLAGVAGIDMVLLVVAADEGIMPQTEEHLDIIRLLGIDKAIIVITKIDIMEAEWREIVKEDIIGFLSDTPLKDSPIVEVSAVTGEGMEELKTEIIRLAHTIEPRSDRGQCRLPIDRTFTVSGFGTTATGTLWSGILRQGEWVEIFPTAIKARIRTLQVHGKKTDIAVAGERVAVNLAGVELTQVPRGGWLADENLLKPSYRLDIELELLPNAKELPHGARVRIYHGTKEVLARIHFLDRESMEGGETAYCQLILEEALAPLRRDRLILRSYSPMHTIGGATIIEAMAHRHRRYDEESLAALKLKAAGRPRDLALEALEKVPCFILNHKEIQKNASLTEEDTAEALELLKHNCLITELAEHNYIGTTTLKQLWQKTERALQENTKNYPLRYGLPKESLRTKIFNSMNAKTMQCLLHYWQEEGKIELREDIVVIKGYEPKPPAEITTWGALTEKTLLSAGYAPPSWNTLTEKLPTDYKNEVLNWLTQAGKAVKVADDIVMHPQMLEQAIKLVKTHLEEKGTLSLGELRDLLQSSRKYSLAILEYMDAAKITKRYNDVRIKY